MALSVGAQAGKIGDQVEWAATNDQAMKAAIAHARATLDPFLALATSPPSGATDFKIKARVSDDVGIEHLWFTPFKEVKGGFAGILANDPQVIKSMQSGSVYVVRREQITDWGYVQNGKQKGSFTVCVLFQSMDQAVVERYKRDHGFECK